MNCVLADYHSIVLAVAMDICHENGAIGGDDDIRRLIEKIAARSGDASLAQRHEHLAA